MRKNIIFVSLVLFAITMIISSCATEPDLDLVLKVEPNPAETSRDVTITCLNSDIFNWKYDLDELISWYGADGETSSDILMNRFLNSRVQFCQNLFNGSIDSYNTYGGFFYAGSGYGREDFFDSVERCRGAKFKEKISGYKAVYTISSKTVSSTFYVTGHNKTGKVYLRINYPETLSFSANNVTIGDQVTVSSSKPFFDSTTFSQDKLNNLLKDNYYIVWVEGDLSDDYHIYSWNNYNEEKRPVTKEYYVDVTTDSITFIVPPYAKTGKVHIINEAGFASVYSLLVTDPNASAYFSSSVDLVVNN